MEGFKCKNCDYREVEEVLNGVTQYTIVLSIELDKDGKFLGMDYGNTNTEGGDLNDMWYQCVRCGTAVDKEELVKITKKACITNNG